MVRGARRACLDRQRCDRASGNRDEGRRVQAGRHCPGRLPAWDDAQQGKRPGVLVVHEWDGLGDYIKMRAEMLAKLGYVAFAPDIYGKGVRPANMQQSAQELSKYSKDRPLMRQRVEAGLKQLKSNPLVDTTRIAAIGYCFGGTTALELGRSGADIAGIVTFHAGLSNPSPEDAKNIKAPSVIRSTTTLNTASSTMKKSISDRGRRCRICSMRFLLRNK